MKNEQLQEIWKQYKAAGNPMPAATIDVARWAIRNKLWKQEQAQSIRQCAEEMSRALREEYRTDRKGRRYRAKLCFRNRQKWLWDDIDSISRGHAERGFAHRRKSIVGDCHQLKIDVDHFNDVHPNEEPIQVYFDFTDDLEERKIGEDMAAF